MSPRQRAASHVQRFFILRHGETNWNASGIIQGSSDTSRLTSQGQSQARQVGQDVFSSRIFSPMDAIYVSPLSRAQETLSLLRQHAATGMLPRTETILHDLREIDLFSWEGQAVTDLKETDAHVYQAWKVGDAQSFVVDGRLPIVETWRRAESVWNMIRQLQQQQQQEQLLQHGPSCEENDATCKSEAHHSTSSLLVCHGTLGQALLCTAFGWDERHFRKHEFPNCGLVEIVWNDKENVATSWKWHYPEETERLHHATVDATLA